jgi:hypothetical protein
MSVQLQLIQLIIRRIAASEKEAEESEAVQIP